jgi:hypothetical protein
MFLYKYYLSNPSESAKANEQEDKCGNDINGKAINYKV